MAKKSFVSLSPSQHPPLLLALTRLCAIERGATPLCLYSSRLDLINGLLFRDRWQPNGRVCCFLFYMPLLTLPPNTLYSAPALLLPFQIASQGKETMKRERDIDRPSNYLLRRVLVLTFRNEKKRLYRELLCGWVKEGLYVPSVSWIYAGHNRKSNEPRQGLIGTP